MIKLYVWRHKTNKDIYLVRNWGLVGGSKDSDFYKATTNIIDAIKAANEPDFEEWMNRFLDDNGVTQLKARVTVYKELEFDGYKGTLKKEICLPVAEFEKVTLSEVASEVGEQE